MYSKLFSSMYDGTLATKGPWQSLVTFQQLLVLADWHGVVDMTPLAISRRTTIPVEIIEKGIKALQEADPESRNSNEDGRRIVPLDSHRNWGWQIVNYEYYRDLQSADERRTYHKKYYHKVAKPKRAASTLSTSSTPRQQFTHLSRPSTHTNTDTTTDAAPLPHPSDAPSPPSGGENPTLEPLDQSQDQELSPAQPPQLNKESEPEKKTRKKPETSLPAEFDVSDRVLAWATEKGYEPADVQAQFEKFVGAAKAKDYRYVDWDAALMNAIRDDWAEIRGKNGNGKAGAQDPADQWWRSPRGIQVKATAVGVEALPGESFESLKARVFEKLKTAEAA